MIFYGGRHEGTKKGLIRFADEMKDVRGIGGNLGVSDAQSNIHRQRLGMEGIGKSRFQGRHFRGGLGSRARHHEEKLVAAPPHDVVHFANVASQELRHELENPVPHVVAIRIVDRFETIDIGEYQTEGRAIAAAAPQRALIQGLTSIPNAALQRVGATLNGALTTSLQTFPDTVRLLESNSGVFPFRSNDNTVSLRLDHAASASNQMFARLGFTDIDTAGGATGGLKGPARGANFSIQDQVAVFGDSHFFGANLVNESRFQYANRDFAVLPADAFGPEITINGVAALGRDFFLPSIRNEKRFQWVDNVTVAAHKHEIKFGGVPTLAAAPRQE